MRLQSTLLVAVMLGSTGLAQEKKPEPGPRFSVAYEGELYPQTSPKTTMTSISKALQRERIDYLVAHLVDPAYADAQVPKFYKDRFKKTIEQERERPDYDNRVKEAFDAVVKEVIDHMASEPKESGYLTRLLKEGTIEEAGTSAKVTHKDVPGLTLTLRQVEGRWFMVNEK